MEGIHAQPLFVDSGSKESIIVGDGDSLPPMKLLIEPRLPCEAPTVVLLREFEAKSFGQRRRGVDAIFHGLVYTSKVDDSDPSLRNAVQKSDLQIAFGSRAVLASPRGRYLSDFVYWIVRRGRI